MERIGINGKPTRPPMENAVRRILEAHGLWERFEKDEFFHAKIANKPYMALTIERLGNGGVSLAHNFVQNGDLMADPDMEFSIPDGWRPMNITQHPMGVFTRASWYKDGRLMTNLRAHKSLMAFAKMWARNLINQGFADPERASVETT